MTPLSEYKIHNFRLSITCVKMESNYNENSDLFALYKFHSLSKRI